MELGKRYGLIGPAYDASTATIVRVIDGDSLEVYLKGERRTVRLLGIDAPETAPGPKAIKDANHDKKAMQKLIARGRESAAYLRRRLPIGTVVRLEYDRVKEDLYDRLLVYVFMSDGSLLNAHLLNKGYADLNLSYSYDLRYARELKEAYKNHKR